MADIVVGYDGSDCGKAALAASANLARELGDRVVVVYSYDVNRLGGEVADMAAALEERGKKMVAEASEEVESHGVEVDAAQAAAHLGCAGARSPGRVAAIG